MLASCLAGSARADQIRYIKRPEEALVTFVGVTQNAQRTLDLATFIFEPCQASGQLMMEELAQKARQGVRVRVLLDAFQQEKKSKKNLVAFFASRGIELRWYNNDAIFNPGSNFRLHAKLLLADTATYIAGGRNVADDYFGLYDGINFNDRDLLVSGASAREAGAAFEELWNAQLTTRAGAGAFRPWASVCGKDLSPRIKQIKNYLAGNAPGVLNKMPARSCARVDFVADYSDFGKSRYGENPKERGAPEERYLTGARLVRKQATKAFLDFIDGTTSMLELENWSYMPFRRIGESLAVLRARNVPVSVVTNEEMDGPGILKYAEEHANSVYIKRDATGSQSILQLSKNGSFTNAYSLTPRRATFRLHGKVAVRDQRDVMVGSFNLDPRSYSTNIESIVRVYGCPALAGDVRSEINILRKTYLRDVESGRVPRPKEPGALAKIVAFLSLSFL